MNKNKNYIYTFYRFKKIKNIKLVKKNMENLFKNKIILGTILIAKEGINGTISGNKNDLDKLILLIKKLLRIRNLSIKVTKNPYIPFYRLKVRIKKEIVTIGDTSINAEKRTGKYIDPKNWNQILKSNEYVVIDTRNKYETDIGTFENSIDLNMNSFREFPKKIKKLDIDKNKPVAMFCTGGIRCEKASSHLLNEGFKNVFQLEGGIINYFESNLKSKRNLWKGECFVFDNRVAIDRNLNRGKYDQCYGCRQPITKKDKTLSTYIKGVSCKYCYDKKSQKKIESSKTRQSQIEYAERNNLDHSFKKSY